MKRRQRQLWIIEWKPGRYWEVFEGSPVYRDGLDAQNYADVCNRNDALTAYRATLYEPALGAK